MGTKSEVKFITRADLERLLNSEPPINDNRRRGFALVGVLAHLDFLMEHIPGSINIPTAKIQQFDQRFDKRKQLIIYGTSPESSGAQYVAEELVRQGYMNVCCYLGGVSDWRLSALGTKKSVTTSHLNGVRHPQFDQRAAREAQILREIV